MPECYIRGTNIKYLRIPDEVIDMVKEDENSGGNRGRRDFRGGRCGGGRGRGGGGRGGGLTGRPGLGSNQGGGGGQGGRGGGGGGRGGPHTRGGPSKFQRTN